jgi:hypothetical protein
MRGTNPSETYDPLAGFEPERDDNGMTRGDLARLDPNREQRQEAERTRASLLREYAAWQARNTDDPYRQSLLSEADRKDLDSGTPSKLTLLHFRRIAFLDLMGMAMTEYEIRHRLGLGPRAYAKFAKQCFDVSNAAIARSSIFARTMLKQLKCERQISAFEARIKDSGKPLTNSEHKIYQDYLRLGNDLEGTISKLLPQQVEVKAEKKMTVTLSVHGTQEQLAPLLDAPADSPPLAIDILPADSPPENAEPSDAA